MTALPEKSLLTTISANGTKLTSCDVRYSSACEAEADVPNIPTDFRFWPRPFSEVDHPFFCDAQSRVVIFFCNPDSSKGMKFVAARINFGHSSHLKIV